jgi:amino acid transporter
VDITGRVLGVLLCAEITVILAETVAGLAHPAGGQLSLATLSPAALTSAGFGTFGVLAVVAVLGFVGFEQAPVLAEEARNARRTVPLATYVALGLIAVVYAGVSWAMAAHAGPAHVVAAAGRLGPGLLFGLGGRRGLDCGWAAHGGHNADHARPGRLALRPGRQAGRQIRRDPRRACFSRPQ